MNAAKEFTFFLVAKLSKDNRAFEWNPDKMDDSIRQNSERYLRPRHSLVLKHAIIDGSATPGALNLVEMKTKDLNGDEVQVPLAFLRYGVEFQIPLNITLAESIVQLKLIEGDGPVYVFGQHVVSAPEIDDELDVEDDDDETPVPLSPIPAERITTEA